jgi:hypothetical protein
MLRDVFYYGSKPNVHPREKFATSLEDARSQAITEHFWIINEYCDYRGFDWDFDFEFLPNEDVWSEEHINVWPSQHQKDSGTWLVNTDNKSPLIIYRADVDVVKRKNIKTSNWVELDLIDNIRFDFSWHPDPNDPPYIYKWGSKFAPVQFKTCLEYHVLGAVQTKYMDQIVELLSNDDCWVEVQKINKNKFDMSWRPDPMDPPMIYVWGNKYIDGRLRSTLEYHVPGATERKYMPELLAVLPEWDRWEILHEVDKLSFDFSWRPDPREPAYNYVWGNKYEEAELKPTLEYRMPGATETKYMEEKVKVLPQWNRWAIIEEIDRTSFDFSWRPDPREPNLIYVFGNDQHEGNIMPTIEYRMPDATERKYLDIQKAKLAPQPKLFQHLENSDGIDYSWRPDPTSPPYIYAWGNQWNKPEDKVSIQYVVEGATEYKYMEERAIRKPCKDNWVIPANVDVGNFDFSWEPSPADPPFIYQFGTQWQKTGGPCYVVEGATEVKFIDLFKVKALPTKEKWTLPANIDVTDFDFSWHPDDTSPPYIYVFSTQWALSGGPVYTVDGATEIKYVEDLAAKALPDKTNWEVPAYIDSESFDFSWHPYAQDEPYIYQFGTQWQKTGGPVYNTPGVHKNSPVKYIDTRILKSKHLPSKKGFAIINNYKIKDFDFSWHPDSTDEPYIYVFGNNLYPAEIMPTIEYIVPGATQIKYVNDIVATLGPDMTNWEVPDNIDVTDFDFSWKPNPKDPGFIYQFGTQWQKTGGPRYVVPDATDVKFIETHKVKALPTKDKWTLPTNIDVDDFDFSWHPDDTSPPYIYYFATQWALSGGPVYTVPGATEVKYVEDLVAKALPDKTNWEVPAFVDADSFDFSWHPYIEDEPYIYQFGTQWQKTGGPKYMTPGVHKNSPVKYIDTRILKSKRLPSKKGFATLNNYTIKDFDYTWHPDTTDDPFIYVFGNNQYPAEVMPTIEYVVPGATQIKYVNDIVATLGTDMNNWEIPKGVDRNNFDFSWKPNPKDPAYIYQFGTQWQKTGGPCYVIEGATEVKYVEDQKATITNTSMKNWEIPESLDISEFDFSWHPDATEKPYIYVFGTQWALTGGPKYIVPEATEVKYVDSPIAKAAPNKKNWIIPDDIDINAFDFSWHPYVDDQPYIYQFGTQWQKTGGPKYMTPGTDEMSPIKYVDTRVLKAKKLSNRSNWLIPKNIDEDSIDYSWHPDDTEPAYIYQFGTQWQKTGGPSYVTPGSHKDSLVKYIDNSIIKGNRLPSPKDFAVLDDIKIADFDYSWHPDETEEPYIYVFGNNQYPAEIMPTVEYRTPGATQVKYVHDTVAKLARDMNNWEVPKNIDVVTFDFSWKPNPKDPAYIYQFGTQWAKTHGPRYVVEGATETKYVDTIKATIMADMTHWEIPAGVNVTGFDFSWHPDLTAPKYIYQFGTLLDDVHLKDGPRYITPDNDGEVVYLENILVNGVVTYPRYYITTTLEDLIAEHSDEIFWALRENIDYTNFDFDWTPSKEQLFNINVFGSAESDITQTYFVNAKLYNEGYTDRTYLEDKKIDEINLAELFVKPSMFFVDRGNSEAQNRFNQLKQQFPDIQKTRYLNTWVDTINRCINRSSTELCWILNSELDYTGFDFNYYPNPWQMKMVHVFGTQWSHWGTTFMVNRETFANDTKYVKIIEHLNNINFVKDRRALATNILYETVYIDHGNKPVPENTLVITYEESYLKTFKKLLEKLPNKKEHYVWVVSSICDYYGFDFTYICDPFARDQLHVFPSDKQKFGDTFLVNVNKLRELIDSVEQLEDIKVNYNQHQRVKRLPAPVIITEGDTHVSSINTDFSFPYATFQTSDNTDIKVIDTEPMNLWSIETKAIQITSVGGTRIVVPKEVKDHVKRELYDYPYIQTSKTLAKSTAMDIVFLSNGETGADENYEHLVKTTQGLSNRVVRVDGVDGRVAAYHAAAKASNTPWMFTVFAKLKVSPKFDWNWQPDRLQIPKHYVFHAKNPVNGLVYGHMAMIAYNKKLTLANEGKGLDFTMDDEHEIVEIVSGTANFNTDEWSTWRTSFREALKLRANTDEISKKRLEFWLTTGMGKFSEYSTDGAQHAVEYYESVNGDFDKLKLSYDWPWLRSYYESKYGI